MPLELFSFFPSHTTCYRWHGSSTVIMCSSSCKRRHRCCSRPNLTKERLLCSHQMFCQGLQSRKILLWFDGRHYFLDLKTLRQTLNTSWFAYLSVTSSPMIEKKAFSFWIGCVTFDRIYAPMIRITSSCPVFEVLVAFPLPVRKCSFKSLPEFLIGIRIAWKLHLFTDAVLVLSLRWPLRGIFCLSHNIMVLVITLTTFMFFSNISWFCVGIPKWRGFLWFLGTLNYRNAGVKCPLMILHFVMTPKCSILPEGFSSFWNGAVTSGFFCAEGFDGVIMHHTKLPIWEELYTSH